MFHEGFWRKVLIYTKKYRKCMITLKPFIDTCTKFPVHAYLAAAGAACPRLEECADVCQEVGLTGAAGELAGVMGENVVVAGDGETEHHVC